MLARKALLARPSKEELRQPQAVFAHA